MLRLGQIGGRSENGTPKHTAKRAPALTTNLRRYLRIDGRDRVSVELVVARTKAHKCDDVR